MKIRRLLQILAAVAVGSIGAFLYDNDMKMERAALADITPVPIPTKTKTPTPGFPTPTPFVPTLTPVPPTAVPTPIPTSTPSAAPTVTRIPTPAWTPTPTPVNILAGSNCVSGLVCFKVDVPCDPPAAGCTPKTVYGRQFTVSQAIVP